MNNWREVLGDTDLFLNVINYFESKFQEYLKGKTFNKREYKNDSQGRGVSYSVRVSDGGSENYSIEEIVLYREIPEILFNFQVRKVIKGESLADSRLNYQNTSAYSYKTKKFSLNKEVSNLQVAVKTIDSFFNKLISVK